MRDKKVDVAKLFESIPKLKFFMPVRDVVECATSNAGNTGYLEHFEHFRAVVNGNGLNKDITIDQVISAVADEIAFFMGIRERFPDRCFFVKETDTDIRTAIRLCEFLEIPPDREWIGNWRIKMDVRDRNYKRTPELMDHVYRNLYEKMPNEQIAYELIEMNGKKDPFEQHTPWLERLGNGAGPV
jgi:hypothetical protein